jgi:integrase
LGIYQRRKIWWIDYYYKGKRLREPVSASRQDALAALAARKGDIARGRYELPETRREWRFDEFSVEYSKQSSISRRWWRRELSRMAVLVNYFGKMFLTDVTRFDVEKYKADRRKTVSGGGVNRELALLKAMFNKAREWGFARMENPVKGVKYYPERQKERILSEDEARRLVRASSGAIRPVLVVALNTGMRKSEILDLSWKNVDFPRRFIRVERSKNNRSRKVPMNSAVHKTLSALRGRGSEYVFNREKGQGRLCYIDTAFKTACRKAGIEGLRFHDLRHTFATNLVMGGVDLVTVKEILGHSDISMTVRYSHPSDERKMSAVERLVVRERAGAGTVAPRKDGHKLVTRPGVANSGARLTH